jgi:NO-binding membrane sensor protein with MHYT domain
VITWSYWAFDACLVVSVLAVALGGVPLWLVMLRRARRARCRTEVALLLAAAVVPAAYLAVSAAVVALVRGPGRPVVPTELWLSFP